MEMEKPFSSTGDPKAASEAALLSCTGGTQSSFLNHIACLEDNHMNFLMKKATF